MATHSSILAWRIPGTGEPGGLLSMGLQRGGHDWSVLAPAAAAAAAAAASLDRGLWFSFLFFFVRRLMAPFANLATWALLFHLSVLLPFFVIMKCGYSAHAKVSGTYLHKKHLGSSLKMCIPSLHIHKVWFCESSVGPKNLSL